MKKLSSVSEVAYLQLKNDILALSVRIFTAKEQYKDIGAEELYELAALLKHTAENTEEWAAQKANET